MDEKGNACMDRTELLNLARKTADRLLAYDDTCETAMALPGGLREGVIRRDFGVSEWDWPQGVGLIGLFALCRLTPSPRYEGFLSEWFDGQMERGLPARNINTTAPLLALTFLPGWERNSKYAALCLDWGNWLMTGAARTPCGGLQHVITSFEDRNAVQLHEGQMWIDTLFMAALFLARAGKALGRADWMEEAVRQVALHVRFLYDAESGLFHHAYSFVRQDHFGGVFWLRGNGWYTLMLPYLLESGVPIPQELRSELEDVLIRQAQALLPLQDGGGLWHTVLRDADSYLETSGSAAVAAGWLHAIRLGLLPEKMKAPAMRCICAVAKRVAQDGTVTGVSAGTVVGENAEHYRRILIAPMAYGQSLALLAFTQAMQA